MQAIAGEEPLAGEILRILAWFGPDPIPRCYSASLTLALPARLQHDHPDPAVGHHSPAGSGRCPPPRPGRPTPHARGDHQARDRAEEILLNALPENPLFNVPSWPRWREILPHVSGPARTLARPTTPRSPGILVVASGSCKATAFMTQASVRCWAVDAYGQLQGPDASDTLTARSFLASAYRAAGDLAMPPPCTERNLADAERFSARTIPRLWSRGPTSPTCTPYSTMSRRALELHSRNLADLPNGSRARTPSHPQRPCQPGQPLPGPATSTALSLHEQSRRRLRPRLRPRPLRDHHRGSNLAYAYQLAGTLTAPSRMHRRVLADRERLYGPDHGHTEMARQLLTAALRSKHTNQRNPTHQTDE